MGVTVERKHYLVPVCAVNGCNYGDTVLSGSSVYCESEKMCTGCGDTELSDPPRLTVCSLVSGYVFLWKV